MQPTPAHQPTPAQRVKRPYCAPQLTSLGTWHALTLAVSVPVGPGGHLNGPSSQPA